MMFKLAIIKTYLKKCTLIKLPVAISLSRGVDYQKKTSWQVLQGLCSFVIVRIVA